MPRFSKRAKRHAKESRQRTKRMLATADQRSGPVVVYRRCPRGGTCVYADGKPYDDGLCLKCGKPRP